MEVISDKSVRRVEIEYANSGDLIDRNAAFDWLDDNLGRLNYRVVRSGPIMTEGKDGTGLIIAQEY